MLYSAQLYQTLSPPNASLESREAACYVTIRLFASLSCCRAGGQGGGVDHTVPWAAMKTQAGEEMQDGAFCFCKPLAAYNKLCQARLVTLPR